MHFAVVLSVLIILTGTSTAQELKLDHCICNDGGVPSDSTFTFRGRLSYWNGNPSFRIWPVGTTRLLGIRGVCLNSLDLGIWNPYHDHELWADFTVSTITPREHGVMQFVCIRSIKVPFLRKKPG
ncbi:MAG: hypothetical protein JNM91_14335 [Flavobacteriales bacterium]|nr:hypothetical protein [Flavobacteriales bacterium]